MRSEDVKVKPLIWEKTDQRLWRAERLGAVYQLVDGPYLEAMKASIENVDATRIRSYLILEDRP